MNNKVTATEWAISGVSIVLVLMLLGFMFHEAVTGSKGPPALSVRQERILPADQSYIVEFVARNTGDSTAKNVEIEGVLKERGKEIEKSRATIDFVPAHAQRRGGLIYARDPRDYTLEIRPKGYDRP